MKRSDTSFQNKQTRADNDKKPKLHHMRKTKNKLCLNPGPARASSSPLAKQVQNNEYNAFYTMYIQ